MWAQDVAVVLSLSEYLCSQHFVSLQRPPGILHNQLGVSVPAKIGIKIVYSAHEVHVYDISLPPSLSPSLSLSHSLSLSVSLSLSLSISLPPREHSEFISHFDRKSVMNEKPGKSLSSNFPSDILKDKSRMSYNIPGKVETTNFPTHFVHISMALPAWLE